MRRVAANVALGLLAALPACAQPYYSGAPAYPAYGPAPYAVAPRYWGSGGHHHHHHAAPWHHHHRPHHHGGHHHRGHGHQGGHGH